MNRLATLAAALLFITVNAQAGKPGVARLKNISINHKLANAMYKADLGHVVGANGKEIQGVHWDLQTRLNDDLNIDGKQVKRYDVLLGKLAEDAQKEGSASQRFLDSIKSEMGEISSMNGAQRRSVAAAYAAWKNPSELDRVLGSRESSASFREDLKDAYPSVAKNISEDSALMKKIIDLSSGSGEGATLRNQAGATILSKLEANIKTMGVEKAVKAAEAEIKTVKEIFDSLKEEAGAAFSRNTAVSTTSGADDLFGATQRHSTTQAGRRLEDTLDIADAQTAAKKAQMITAELQDSSPGTAERVRLAFADPEKSDVLLKVFDRVKNELEPEFIQQRSRIEEEFERANGRKAFNEAELWGFFVKKKTDVDIYAKGGVCEKCTGKKTVCK